MEQTKSIVNQLPKHIIDLFEGHDIGNIPYLEYHDRFRGDTDYIDRITIKDVNQPIMFSVDCFRRPLITFRLNFKANKDKAWYEPIKKDEEVKIVNTYFQRYTDCDTPWCIGIAYGQCFMIGNVVPNKDDIDGMKKLLSGESIIINDFTVTLY